MTSILEPALVAQEVLLAAESTAMVSLLFADAQADSPLIHTTEFVTRAAQLPNTTTLSLKHASLAVLE